MPIGSVRTGQTDYDPIQRKVTTPNPLKATQHTCEGSSHVARGGQLLSLHRKGPGAERGERPGEEKGGAFLLVRNGRRRRDELSPIPILRARHVPSLLLFSSSSASPSRCKDRIRFSRKSRVCTCRANT